MAQTEDVVVGGLSGWVLGAWCWVLALADRRATKETDRRVRENLT